MTAVGLNRPDIVAAHGTATVHSLRHTFASWLLQNGADLSEVQHQLGHHSMQMTLRYAHLQQHKTAAKLGALLSEVAPKV
jgi:site-specific recombinase XerD